MRHPQIGWVAVGLLALGAGPAWAAGNPAASRGYAESMYAEYAAGTGNQLSFDVKTLSTGSMKQIAEIPFGQLIAPSNHLVNADQVGTELRAPRWSLDGTPDSNGGQMMDTCGYY